VRSVADRVKTAVCWLALCAGPVFAQTSQPPPGPVPGQAQAASDPASAATPQEVRAARDKVMTDPDLGSVHKERSLRFKPSEPSKSDTPAKREPTPPWLFSFALWLAEAGRVVIWVLGALAVALILVGLRHWVKVRADVAAAKSIKLPSHVRELDIRPESLPDQIGAAARTLWQQGEQHAALSLLYRGALSRLVHNHAVPIRAASTEGECVQLAARRLSPERGAFFGRLVSAWQLTVYGARLPEPEAVLALCDSFDAHLGAKGTPGVAP